MAKAVKLKNIQISNNVIEKFNQHPYNSVFYGKN